MEKSQSNSSFVNFDDLKFIRLLVQKYCEQHGIEMKFKVKRLPKERQEKMA